MSEASAPEINLKVLVVCLGKEFHVDRGDQLMSFFLAGNICRSPMGEAVLEDIARKRGIPIKVDSCGTVGYHVGENPDDRCVISTK
jgi:hypothetical protein